MLRLQLFHGTRRMWTGMPSPSAGSCATSLGSGLYLTDDLETANCYSSGGGFIYRLDLEGPANGVLDFDKPLSEQHPDAAWALLSLLGAHQVEYQGDCPRTALGVAAEAIRSQEERQRLARVPPIHVPAPFGFAVCRDHLAAQGVWLVRGTLAGMEMSGRQDRGVQYVLTSARAVRNHFLHGGALDRAPQPVDTDMLI